MVDHESLGRSLFEIAHEPLLLLDDQHRVHMANRTFYETFALTPEQSEGRVVYDLGGGRWDIPELRALLEELLPANSTFEGYEISHSFPDIGRRVILINGRQIESPETGDMVLLTFLDVTEGRLSEERLSRQILIAKLLFRATALATETDSIEEALEHCVDAVHALIGWPVGHVFFVPADPKDPLVPTNIWKLADNETYASLREATESLRFHRGVGVPGTIWQTQQLYWVENIEEEQGFIRADVCRQLGLKAAFGFPIRVGGEAKAVLEFFNTKATPPSTDILSFCGSIAEPVGRVIERNLATKRLRAAKRAADKANQAKSQFLANVSHELRTPMNAILGMLHLALEEEQSATLRDHLQTAKLSADELLVLLNDVLDFSKLEAGEFVLEEEPFSVRELIDETMKPLAPKAFQKGIELAYDVAPDMPESLVGAHHRLRQVLTNVVGNAIKFTETGEVVVRIRPAKEEPRRRWIDFTVTDTGIGIPVEQQEKIFAPFTQADASTTRQYGGTGLGLAITRQIVNRMGGSIAVESQPNAGSQFRISVPFRPNPKTTRRETRETPSLVTLRGMSVLVVDDNHSNRKILAQMLENWGMHPQLAGDGDEALGKLRRAAETGRRFPLIIVDALMPGMDGFMLTDKVIEDEQIATPVILMLSSADRRIFAERADATRVAAYLQKPVSQSDLLDAMVTALDVHGESSDVPSPVPPPLPEQSPLAILLAEDTPANQKVVVSILKKRGHSVTVAENGREAVELFKEIRFDVVLMDVQMPIMDGYQATAALRAQEAAIGTHTPIVAMTAHAMKGDRERSLAAGMDAYLAKPIDVSRLVQLVEELGRTNAAANAPPTPTAAPAPGAATDLAGALKRLDGDTELLSEFIGYFQQDAPPLLEALKKAVAGDRAADAQKAAHSLHGLAANFGAERVVALAARLEEMAAGGDVSAAADTLSQLDFEVVRLRDELSRFTRANAMSRP